MNRISIIIPIFNTGKRLYKTLNSIKAQTLSNFECLLIDDGSTDIITKKICKEFAQTDSRFKYFEKHNEGIELTRLFGVDKSSYDLIMFSDHDDYYERKAFEIFINAYLKSKADIIVSNCFYQYYHNANILRSIIKPDIIKEVILGKNEFIQKHFLNFFGKNSFPVSTWGKMYHKKLFTKKLKTFDVSFIEDIVINTQVFDRAEKFHLIPQVTYTHIYGGLSSTFSFRRTTEGYNKIYQLRKNYLNKYDMSYESVLIEFKNVIIQNIDKLLEDNYEFKEFNNQIEGLPDLEIYQDLLLTNIQHPYLDFLRTRNYIQLFLTSKSKNNTPKRKLIQLIKKSLK